jgi:hypothetical protein
LQLDLPLLTCEEVGLDENIKVHLKFKRLAMARSICRLGMSEAPNEILSFSVVHMIPADSSYIDRCIVLFSGFLRKNKVGFSLCV